LRLGAQCLSDAELLQVVAGAQARAIADYGLHADGLGPDWLTHHCGLSQPAACRLLAAFELSRRTRQSQPRPRTATPEAVVAYLKPYLEGLSREEMHVLYLGPRNAVLHHRACAVIVAHNHPSGDPQPSASDILLTKRLSRAGEALNIKVLDHLVIGQHGSFSFLAHGLMPARKTR
jgi:DNA repair protein RadC